MKNIVTDCDFEDYDFEGDMSRNFFFSLSQKVGECCVSKGQGMIEGGLHMRRRRRRLLRWPKEEEEEEAGVGRPYVRKVAGWRGTDEGGGGGTVTNDFRPSPYCRTVRRKKEGWGVFGIAMWDARIFILSRFHVLSRLEGMRRWKRPRRGGGGGNKRIFVASFHGFFFVGRKSRWFVIFFAPCGPPR